MLSAILGSIAVLSAGINVWQWWAAGRFPLHRRHGRRDFAPGLTLFKPLKGADSQTRACLESWFTQDYGGPLQILFGVADGNDPVCEIVRALRKEFPHIDSELIICDPILGPNAKVSTLTYLEKKAKHPFIVVSDADVFAPPDLLAEMSDGFRDEKVALLNCFYKYGEAHTVAMLWESIGINSDFWSQVCQSNSIKPMNFALGAVMAIRRERWEKLGGFATLLNQLADDYQLGHRLAEAGGKVDLCNVVVECRESPKIFRAIQAHQLRWARTIRVCQPGPYFFSVLSNVTVWSMAWAFCGGANAALQTCIWIRLTTALHNNYRLTRSWRRAAEAILFQWKDILQFFVWLASFIGSTVVWRGERFRVKRGGELEAK